MKFAGVFLGGCLLAALDCSRANVVANNLVANNADNWQVNGNGLVNFNSAITFLPNTSLSSNPNLGGTGGTICQAINTTPGAIYEISFSAFEGQAYEPTAFNFSFGDVCNTALGTTLFNQSFGAAHGFTTSPWVNQDFFVTADSSLTALSFAYCLPAESTGIVLNGLSIHTVPDDTSTAALLTVASTGLLCSRRWLSKSR